MKKKSKRGFASLDKDRLREIASQGGKASSRKRQQQKISDQPISIDIDK